MKIQIICSKCGKIAELESTQVGNQVQMGRIQNKGFYVYGTDIEKNGDIEDIEDIDDVEVELKSVRIDCQGCGDYIVMEF